jgi:hypothetical protein
VNRSSVSVLAMHSGYPKPTWPMRLPVMPCGPGTFSESRVC